ERLALVALVAMVLESNRTVSEGEIAEIDRVVGELGHDEYRRLVDEVDRRFSAEEDLKLFLPAIVRQDPRELIHGPVLDAAIGDGVDVRESALLDWLGKLWNVRVQVEDDAPDDG